MSRDNCKGCQASIACSSYNDTVCHMCVHQEWDSLKKMESKKCTSCSHYRLFAKPCNFEFIGYDKLKEVLRR